MKVHIVSKITRLVLCGKDLGWKDEIPPTSLLRLKNDEDYCKSCLGAYDNYFSTLEEIASWLVARIDLDKEFDSRKNRLTHPRGSFDRSQRWYPDDVFERASCCIYIRMPSVRHPNSLNRHCRSKAHLETLREEKPFLFVEGSN